LGASQQVQDAVASIGFSRPSHVQAEAYKALRSKSGFRHVALADQAGSGKTLAYLLPLLQQLKEREEQLGEPATQPNSPSIIILTPTTGDELLR
jgi:ATP-dependent RNA helicase DDX18/HAS1